MNNKTTEELIEEMLEIPLIQEEHLQELAKAAKEEERREMLDRLPKQKPIDYEGITSSATINYLEGKNDGIEECIKSLNKDS